MQQSWSGGWISDKHRPALPPGAPPHPLPVACRVALAVPALGSECMGDLLGRLSAADARRGAGDNRPLTAIERDGESIWLLAIATNQPWVHLATVTSSGTIVCEMGRRLEVAEELVEAVRSADGSRGGFCQTDRSYSRTKSPHCWRSFCLFKVTRRLVLVERCGP